MDILFSCDQCGQQMTIDSQYAGMTTNCTNCQAEVVIPAEVPEVDEAAAEASFAAPEEEQPIGFKLKRETPAAGGDEAPWPEKPAVFCSHCGSALPDPNALHCLECGHNPHESPAAAGRMARKIGLVTLITAGATLLSALIWGGISAFFQYEHGFVAALIGLIVGGTIRLLTPERSARLGLIAVLLAVGGIMLGKYLGFVYFVQKSGVAQLEEAMAEILSPEEIPEDKIKDVLYDRMAENKELVRSSQFVREFFQKHPDADPDSPEFAAMLKENDALVDANEARRDAKLANLSDEEKKLLREHYINDFIILGIVINHRASTGAIDFPENPESDDLSNEEERALSSARRKALFLYRVQSLEAAEKIRGDYQAMSPEQQEAVRAEARQLALQSFQRYIRSRGFFSTFSMIDILFFVLAIVVAWRFATSENPLSRDGD